MTLRNKNFILAISALALLAGCDDNGGENSGLFGWMKKKDDRRTALVNLQKPFTSDSEAGNYLAAQFAQARQDWPAAQRYFDRLMTMDQGNIDLEQRAMVLAMQAGEPARAIDLAQKVLSRDKKNLLALLFVSVSQMQKEDYAGAVKTLQSMPGNGIADFIRPILIDWAKAPSGPFDEDALIASGPLHAYHALLIADFKGKVAEPEKYLVNVLSGGGADRHILESMADVYARQGQKALAEKIYDTLIKDSEASIGTSSRIDALEAKRNNIETVKPPKIEKPSSGAAEAFYNMARILFQDKSDESALVFARIAQYLDPAKDDIKMLLATMMVRSEHAAEAVKLYKSVQPGVPGYKEAMRSAADLMEENGHPEDAISFLEDNYEKTKDVDFLIQIGDVHRRAEKYKDAIDAYDRAEKIMGGKISSDYWSLLYARGMSYERVGDMKKAEDDLTAALEFQPDHPYLLNYLAYSWADQGKNLDKALEMLKKASEIRPDDGYIADSLGWVYFRKGDYVKAAAELEKAVEMVPYDATINDHLGDAYWLVGRKNEARFQWQRALNSAEEKAGDDTSGDEPKTDDKLIGILKDKIENGLESKDAALKNGGGQPQGDNTGAPVITPDETKADAPKP